MDISLENEGLELEHLNTELDMAFKGWQLEDLTGDPKKEPDFGPQRELWKLIETGIRNSEFDVEIVALRNDGDGGNSKEYDNFRQKKVINEDTAMITAVTLLGLGISERRFPIIEIPESRHYIQLIQDKYTQLTLNPDEVISLKFVKHIPVRNY